MLSLTLTANLGYHLIRKCVGGSYSTSAVQSAPGLIDFNYDCPVLSVH